MTKERILEIYHGSTDPDYQADPIDFARALLLECAKSVCINCKDGNESLPTKEPHRRIHKLTATWSESCRAPSFFLEDE